MSFKYVVFVIALCAPLVSCGSNGTPEANSTNCSGTGMQAALPTFKTEADRQAFIDKCESLAKK